MFGLDRGSTSQQESDGYKIAATAGADGMKVWFYLSVPDYIRLVSDHRGFDNQKADCRLGASGPVDGPRRRRSPPTSPRHTTSAPASSCSASRSCALTRTA
jgi:hypothetical protein